MNDGVSLRSAAHPRLPWYQWLWHWVSLRRLHPSTLETIEIDVASAARQRQNILNSVMGTNMNDNEIEKEIQAKGLTAPRVSLADIEACIAYEYYITGGGINNVSASVIGPAYKAVPDPENVMLPLTLCVLVLANGFMVIGESAPVSAENFDASLGRKVARNKALDKIWMLEGYRLKQVLYDAGHLPETPLDE